VVTRPGFGAFRTGRIFSNFRALTFFRWRQARPLRSLRSAALVFPGRATLRISGSLGDANKICCITPPCTESPGATGRGLRRARKCLTRIGPCPDPRRSKVAATFFRRDQNARAGKSPPRTAGISAHAAARRGDRRPSDTSTAAWPRLILSHGPASSSNEQGHWPYCGRQHLFGPKIMPGDGNLVGAATQGRVLCGTGPGSGAAPSLVEGPARQGTVMPLSCA